MKSVTSFAKIFSSVWYKIFYFISLHIFLLYKTTVATAHCLFVFRLSIADDIAVQLILKGAECSIFYNSTFSTLQQCNQKQHSSNKKWILDSVTLWMDLIIKQTNALRVDQWNQIAVAFHFYCTMKLWKFLGLKIPWTTLRGYSSIQSRCQRFLV